MDLFQQHFSEVVTCALLSPGAGYNLAGVCFLDPREVANFPLARQRKYVLMLKKGLELTQPLDSIVQALSMNVSKQSSSSWNSLLLPLDVKHTCNASLQSRAYLSVIFALAKQMETSFLFRCLSSTRGNLNGMPH